MRLTRKRGPPCWRPLSSFYEISFGTLHRTSIRKKLGIKEASLLREEITPTLVGPSLISTSSLVYLLSFVRVPFSFLTIPKLLTYNGGP